MLQKFPTEEASRKYLEKILWNGHPVCPFCSHQKVYSFKDGKTHKCAECKKNFTVLKGTIFERSHIPLNKWFYAIYLFASHKKGLSSHQLARDIEITQSNAWKMLHRIRIVMNNNKQFKQVLDGIVEIDETFVGGKNRNRHWNKKVKNSQGRATIDKAPVLGLISKGGHVLTIPIRRLKKKGMQLLIRNKVKPGATIVTDEFLNYRGLDKYFDHKKVNHGAYQFTEGEFTTNSIEGFWTWLKRGIFGIYHSVSKKFLFRYCDEYEYRYNTRAYSEDLRFDTLLQQTLGCRTYCNNLF